MKSSVLLFLVAALACVAHPASATSNLPASGAMPDIAHLRTNCGTTADCTTTVAELSDWINNVRKPNSASRLHVLIGPGIHLGKLSLVCAAGGFEGSVAFSGPGQKGAALTGAAPVIDVSGGCKDLSFRSFSVYSTIYYAILWAGGGSSVWADMDVTGGGYAWVSITCGLTPGSHVWFASMLSVVPVSNVALTYVESCDASRFFGTNMMAGGPFSSTRITGDRGVINARGAGRINFYGGNLRMTDNAPAGSAIAPVASAAAGGQIHIHGTGIDATSGVGRNIVALSASGGGEIHANESAYFLKTTGGSTISRIVNNGGHVHAPYHWEPHSTPPPQAEAVGLPVGSAVPPLGSQTGADTAIVTDDPSGHPRMVIYDASCASRWFDSTANACRP